ncbi:MAG: biotin transporter BioY, partial [Candidatus Pacebacteria bacterium]|nr:biotin transporter BioY [Candidatus Paceibacterota bacterium]
METKLLKIDNILNIESRFLSLMKDLVLIIAFAFLTGVSAKISFGIGIIPITMQTLVVLLSGVLLGSKRGALSQLMYLITGIAGIPLF